MIRLAKNMDASLGIYGASIYDALTISPISNIWSKDMTKLHMVPEIYWSGSDNPSGEQIRYPFLALKYNNKHIKNNIECPKGDMQSSRASCLNVTNILCIPNRIWIFIIGRGSSLK